MAALSATAAAGGPSLLDEAFAPAVLGALDRVRLRTRQASGERPGHTAVRGRSDPAGTEIERHTPYAQGDDLRRVDWNTYARLGELLTRRFVAEREVPVCLAIDTSASMGPPGPGSKLDMAAAIAAILGAVSLAGGDRVYLAAIPGRGSAGGAARGGHGGGAGPAAVAAAASSGAAGAAASAGAAGAASATSRPTAERCGPLRSRRSLRELRAFLSTLEPAPGVADLAGGLERALRDVRRGLVVVVSDFLVEPEAIERLLDVIGARRCEGKIVQVLSREDRDPSWLHGRDTLVDSETGATLRFDSSPEALRRYEAALAAHVAAVSAAAARRAMTGALTVSDSGLRGFLREDLRRLGLRLVR